MKAARDFARQRVALERRYARDCENLRKRAEKSVPIAKTLGEAWDSVLRSMASAEEQHTSFADSLEEEVDRPLREILERKKFRDIQRKISTCKQMSAGLRKRIRTKEIQNLP